MKVEGRIAIRATAISLIALSLFETSRVTHTEHTPGPVHEARTAPASPREVTKKLGAIAVTKSPNSSLIPHTQATTITRPPLAPVSSAAAHPTPSPTNGESINQWSPEQVSASATYLHTRLIPLIQQQHEGLKVVTPTHTDKEHPVNNLGSVFIVTAATGDQKCGVQLWVKVNTDQKGQSNIAPTVYGRTDVLSDGRTYAPEGNGLAHAEAQLGFGEDFSENNPLEGVVKAEEIYKNVCGTIAPRLGLIPSTP